MPPSLDMVRTALDYDEDDTADDVELQVMLTAAEAEYESLVGLVEDAPANHVLTIVADVASLWRATQRGGDARPDLINPEDGYERANAAMPLTLFPRIRGLAKQARTPSYDFPDANDWPCW